MAIAVACLFGTVMSLSSVQFVIPLVFSIAGVMLFFLKSYTQIKDVDHATFAFAFGWTGPAFGKSRSFLDFDSAVIRRVTVVKTMRVGRAAAELSERQDREKLEGLFIYQGREKYLLLEATSTECVQFYKKFIQPHGLKLYNGAPIPRQEMRV
jgi:hypothetical protein